MRKETRFAALAMAMMALLTGGCKEIGPDVRFEPPADLGDRVVLIEEFTGVQCVFCPPGTEELENLLVLYPDNLAVVSLHTGFFATPIPNKSKYDFRTTAADNLNNLLGTPDKGYPSAIVNRKQYPGETSLHTTKGSWAGYIEQEAAQDPAMGLDLDFTFDPATRRLAVQVNALGRSNVSTPLRVTVMVTESGIVDYQKDIRFGDIADYVHKHVFRGMLNAATNGDLLSETGIAVGQKLSWSAELVLPDTWKAEKCELVAFVSDGNSKYVLQAAKKKMG